MLKCFCQFAHFRLVSWFVSHCDTPSQREKFVERMKKVVSVDIYGKCSNNTNASRKMLPRDTQEEKDELSLYKFYIAFENSLCPEYVTEKLYKIINTNIHDNPPVPIVMGPNKSFYESRFPVNSFIHVDDFNHPETLGYYLNQINSKPSLYLKYLDWRRTHTSVCEHPVRCKLCQMLLNKKYTPYHKMLHIDQNDLIISNFEAFWQRSKCQNKNIH